ncbi:MAG: RNA polymerase sigma factor [Rhodocyclaceae bacterium]|nr:RNA polymerase sigma factor [Rhodocyclaceae bacterium]
MNILGFFGRSRAYEARLEQSRPRLYRLAHSWCRNPAVADDVVQDTLAKALAQAGQLRDLDALHGWLLTIMANCWRDHFRRTRETEDLDEVGEEWLASEFTPEDDFEQNQMIQRVRGAVSRLPLGQRQVVTLVDLEECSYAEVAGILGIPIGTVMSRLSRARIALRELLLDHRKLADAPTATRISRIK